MSDSKHPVVRFREDVASHFNAFRKVGSVAQAAGLDQRPVIDLDPTPKNQVEAAIPALLQRRGRISHVTEQLEAELADTRKRRRAR